MINSPLIYFLNTNGVALLVLATLAYLWFIEREKEEALHVLLAVTATFVVSIVLKELFSLPRPYVVESSDPLAGLVLFASFPSTHTAIAFALATTVTMHQRRFGAFLFIVAALASLGRVAANVHYPVDIIFGVLIGSLIGIFFATVHIKTKKKR